ncbi:MAG: hypothetical protein ACJA2M_001331 [Polaribacter sp.]|jgi:hypothetical protein
MTKEDKEQLNIEVSHIFESGANHLRIFEMVENFIDKRYKAINYTRCCETLKDKYEIVFEDWLKDHKFKQSNNGFNKNGIEYKVNEITWMYIQDVYNL